MATNLSKQIRYVAVGYGIFAGMYVAIIGMLMDAAGWSSVDQLSKDLKLMGNTPYLLVGAFSLNLALAIGTWRIFSLQRIARNIIVGVAIAVATFLVANILWVATQWLLRPSAPSQSEVSMPLISSLFLAFAYAYLAFMLTRVVVISNSAVKRDAPQAARPLP